MGSVYFFCHKTMENLGSDPNAPPVLPPGITVEEWLHTLTEYAKKMKVRLPHLKHPTDAYLTEGAQLFSQDGDPSAGGTSSSPPDAPQEARMVKIERILEEHTQRNNASEIRARQIYIEQRERDRVSRIAKFGHATTKFHCADLFDMETHILDLADHVRHLVPNLAPLVGQPLLNVTDLELRVDSSRQYMEKQLVPMIGMIWKLARFIDDCIQVHEAAGACSVGYTQFYHYKNTQIFGNEKFSGSKADREFWTHDTFDTEKDILKMQAHHRMVAQSGGQLPKVLTGSNTARKDNYLMMPGPSKTARNRKQCHAYNKRKKAKAAQQPGAAKPANTPAPATATTVKKNNP